MTVLYLWTEPLSNEPRTTNGSEPYHCHFKDQFYNPLPLFYNFIEAHKEHRTKIYLKIQPNERKTTIAAFKSNPI